MIDKIFDFVNSGGWAMWPLILMSVVSLTLTLERGWFWMRQNSGRSLEQARMGSLLMRKKDFKGAKELVAGNDGVYAAVIGQLIDERAFLSEASGVDAIENQRWRMERFMATLSTVITAAPMIGILGTVTGIISSFDLLGGDAGVAADPTLVSQGIAEALITTGAGLSVAILTLFPYNLFRSQLDRAFGRLESIVGGVEGEAASDA